MRNDPRFVKWFGRYYEYEDDHIIYQKSVEISPCTAEDLAKFDTAESGSAKRIEKFMKEGGLVCLDWKKANISLYGADSDYKHSTIDIIAMPCHVRETQLGGE